MTWISSSRSTETFELRAAEMLIAFDGRIHPSCALLPKAHEDLGHEAPPIEQLVRHDVVRGSRGIPMHD